jgi:hypothetical protein
VPTSKPALIAPSSPARFARQLGQSVRAKSLEIFFSLISVTHVRMRTTTRNLTNIRALARDDARASHRSRKGPA